MVQEIEIKLEKLSQIKAKVNLFKRLTGCSVVQLHINRTNFWCLNMDNNKKSYEFVNNFITVEKNSYYHNPHGLNRKLISPSSGYFYLTIRKKL